MLKFAARTAIVVIGGALVISQGMLVASSVMKADWGWALLALFNGTMISAMVLELWERANSHF